MADDPNQVSQQNTEEEPTPETAACHGTAGTDVIVGSDEDDSISSNAGVDATDFVFAESTPPVDGL